MYHPGAEEHPVYVSEVSEIVKLFQSHTIRCRSSEQDEDKGSFIRWLSWSLLPKVVALPPAMQPCHLFTCQLRYLSHPFSELFWVITSAEIFLGRWRIIWVFLLNYPTESSQGKEGWCKRRVRTTCLAVRGWLPLLVGVYGFSAQLDHRALLSCVSHWSLLYICSVLFCMTEAVWLFFGYFWVGLAFTVARHSYLHVCFYPALPVWCLQSIL